MDNLARHTDRARPAGKSARTTVASRALARSAAASSTVATRSRSATARSAVATRARSRAASSTVATRARSTTRSSTRSAVAASAPVESETADSAVAAFVPVVPETADSPPPPAVDESDSSAPMPSVPCVPVNNTDPAYIIHVATDAMKIHNYVTEVISTVGDIENEELLEQYMEALLSAKAALHVMVLLGHGDARNIKASTLRYLSNAMRVILSFYCMERDIHDSRLLAVDESFRKSYPAINKFAQAW